MKIIKYKDLLNYLIEEEGLTIPEALRTIRRIRQLDPRILKGIEAWIDGDTPDLAFAGVSYADLVETEKMRPIRAFLFLDWLRREPAIATDYLCTKLKKDSVAELDDANRALLEEAARRLQAAPDEPDRPEDETDIRIP